MAQGKAVNFCAKLKSHNINLSVKKLQSLLNSLSKRAKMKKLLLCAVFVAVSVIGLNAENLKDSPLFADCFHNENKNSCQKLIDDGLLNIDECDKTNCNHIGLVYQTMENYQQAIKYFQKAAELGNANSYHNLGVSYEKGEGVKQNFFEAFKHYQKACDLNFFPACNNVGVFYQKGQGARQNFVNAKKYYEKACNANLALACNNLGILYGKGQGVKQNFSVAKKIFGKACDLGEQKGCDNYRKLNEQGVK